jgi:hypothetical protein
MRVPRVAAKRFNGLRLGRAPSAHGAGAPAVAPVPWLSARGGERRSDLERRG